MINLKEFGRTGHHSSRVIFGAVSLSSVSLGASSTFPASVFVSATGFRTLISTILDSSLSVFEFTHLIYLPRQNPHYTILRLLRVESKYIDLR